MATAIGPLRVMRSIVTLARFWRRRSMADPQGLSRSSDTDPHLDERVARELNSIAQAYEDLSQATGRSVGPASVAEAIVCTRTLAARAQQLLDALHVVGRGVL
jgi:hypothetical protein